MATQPRVPPHAWTEAAITAATVDGTGRAPVGRALANRAAARAARSWLRISIISDVVCGCWPQSAPGPPLIASGIPLEPATGNPCGPHLTNAGTRQTVLLSPLGRESPRRASDANPTAVRHRFPPSVPDRARCTPGGA